VLLTLVLALVVAAMGMLVASLSKTAGQADSVGTILGFVLAGYVRYVTKPCAVRHFALQVQRHTIDPKAGQLKFALLTEHIGRVFKWRDVMSRTVFGLLLGGALLLIAAACGPRPASEITSANVESPEADSPDIENAEVQSPEIYDNPVVTVNLSPT